MSLPQRIPVLVTLPFPGPLDYAPPGGAVPPPGTFVDVPLGPRRVTGVVWDGAGEGIVAAAKLRPIALVHDWPAMTAKARRFLDWMAGYTMAPPGMVLRHFANAANNDAAAPVTGYAPTGRQPDRVTPARKAVLELLAAEGALAPAAILAATGVTSGVLRGLVDGGALRPVALAAPPAPRPDPDFALPALSEGQAAVAGELTAAVGAGGYRAFLLDGVTGSGKTEVYLEAIATALRSGRQALVLLPEIALTAGLLERFAARFGVAPAVWHSDLTPAARRRVWRGVAAGAVGLVIGARSALFLPFADLGVIIVDEEHDQGFKQDDGVAYHGRDMAVVRATIEDCPIVLASATPSLETLANVEAGRYRRLVLPERHGGAMLPEVQIVDMRANAPERGNFLSPVLTRAMAECLARGEQSLLFLNRRGYAPLTLCRHCGHRIECPNCTAWLVEHRNRRQLECHHCGHIVPKPHACPECGEEDSLVACGPGVERIDEEVANILPQARRLILASDTLGGPLALAAAFDAIAAREVDVVIGTQIVAKGHHFPFLTLVGVVDADLGLDGGDLRAGERIFQLTTQVVGRAGRGERPGRALIQSFDPEAGVIRAIARNDRDGFVAAEQAARKRHGLPPYGRLVAIILSGPDQGEVMTIGRHLARTAPRDIEGFDVLGPAPAPLSLLRGRHRVRLLVRAPRRLNVQAVLRPWLDAAPVPGRVRMQVDVDPYHFM
ncbi:primosomal protein N' [Zavarzinia compransoris]|uniref:Replication restart protein PriA n=1 Tax=Zavarzinia compransoris TaxID=1264899 RepID=A0A317E3R0_9PROT|nr:primosomal protein N' [Zavarzinia compransoris]PWR20840.1 primosomal protein N' [Zavarzinia compransoris]TDP44324.1 replication restart DNA helicase PriA [Zavarzinia compransoris]